MDPQPITLLNTGLPLVVLGAAGAVVPHLLLPLHTRSLALLAVVAFLSVPILFLIGMVVFGLVMWAEGANVAGALAAAPGYVLGQLAWSAMLSSLVWGPALVLSALSLAQRIERVRGEDIVRQGR
jgi:hypothetical protein